MIAQGRIKKTPTAYRRGLESSDLEEKVQSSLLSSGKSFNQRRSKRDK